MPEYRRVFNKGGTYFFTVVTYERRSIFIDQNSRDLYLSVLQSIQRSHPFEQLAYCILPDHIHCIWALPGEEHDYSLRWKSIKIKFSRIYQYRFGQVVATTESRKIRGEVGIWQRRFWEHTIRDDDDLYEHIDYIHFNPVKHGLVADPLDWKWSSYRQYESEGYSPDPWRELKQMGRKIEYGE